MKRKLLLLKILLSVSCLLPEQVHADIPAEIPDYDLPQILVTANRYEKRDVDTAASTEILTREDLEKTGTNNVVTALSNLLGITYMGYGPEGSSMGAKNSSLMIRGMDKGTLVLINGSPINLNGRYNLEDMPFDGIERIEVVRGGGSVLYGSEASGGVINIITSKNVKNKVSVGAGSRDKQQYDLSFQAKKLSVAASHKHWGHSSKASDLLSSTKNMSYNMRDMDRSSLYLNYAFNDQSSLTYQHTQSKKDYDYVFGQGYAPGLIGETRYNRLYRYKKDFLQYKYDDGSWSGNIYYNLAASETANNDFLSSTGSNKGYPTSSYDKDKDYSYGGDITKKWRHKNDQYLLGFTYQHAVYNPDTYAGVDYSKDSYSLFAQIDKALDKKNSVIVSGRQSWDKMTEKSFHNFSGQLQYLYKLTENDSLYASVGQSYRMPYLREMYASGKNYLAGNTDLKPEKGIHYELGWKKQADKHLYKVAFFNYYIEDNITYTLGRSGGVSYSTNSDAKNTGIEASMSYHNNNGFSYNAGISYSDPKSKTRADNAPSSVTVKDYWDRQYGRVQLNGGIGYTKDKWSANLTANYMYKRVASPSSSKSFDIKPYLLTSLNVKYQMDKNSDLTFSMENLLNREDNYGGSTTAYYSTPRCFLLKYTYSF